jgi:phosphate transport system protein
LRIANEIERIGDLAKNIGKRIVAMNGEDMPRRSMRGVNHMAALMLTQLRDVPAKAVEVWTRDQDIDRLCTSLSHEFLAHMLTVSIGRT